MGPKGVWGVCRKWGQEFGPESWDQRVGNRSWDQELGPEGWGRRVATKDWDQRDGAGGCVESLMEVESKSSDRRVGTKELGPGVGARGLGPQS